MAKNHETESVNVSRKNNYDFRTSAFVATIIAVFLLGATIFLFAKNEDRKQEISELQNQLSSLQESVHQKNIKENGVSYRGVNGKSALELLKKNHTVETKDYSYGKMIVSIDGIAADNNNFWSFNVDGKMANNSADNYSTKNEENITWKLTELN